MTRNDAIEIERKKLEAQRVAPLIIDAMATTNIDALIELGLLKVEEPYKPIFIYSIGGEDKLAVDIRHSLFHVTPIIRQIGDTLGLSYEQVQNLKTAIRQWEEIND